MNTNQTKTTKGKRLHFLDNTRTAIIFLVILLHACGPYLAGDMWGSFWIVDDPANNNVSGIIFLILDIFLMATLFFISGYLAPASLKRKSGWEFLKGKFKRLMLPWAAAVLILIPLYKVIFRFSRGLPHEHWTTYFHITNPNSQNWLWFLPVLFAFNLLYLLISKMNLRLTKLSVKAAVVITFIIGVGYKLAMDLLGLNGWTLTPLIDFQNERILFYVMFFLVGALFFNRGVFTTKPEKKTLYIIVNATSWLPINIYIFTILWPLVFNPGNYIFSQVIDRIIVAFTFNLTLITMAYTLVESFRFYGDKTSRIWKELNRNSYYVYIIHVIVTGIITLLLRDTGIPSLLKHLILTLATFVVSNLIVSASRALLKAIFPGRKQGASQTIESV